MLAVGHDDLGEIVNKQMTEILTVEFLNLKKNYLNEELYRLFKNHAEFIFNKDSMSDKTFFNVFTHKSFSHESNNRFENNEKLEFLGDAVLELLVTEKINKLYTELDEGQLSKLRSSLVNEDSLHQLSLILKLDRLILLGKGEMKSEGYKKASILSDTFEALLGGYFLENGFEKTKNLFEEMIEVYQKKTKRNFFELSKVQSFDAKTKLQELVMKKFKSTPKYECFEIQDKGEFEINCLIDDKLIAQGVYPSKKKGMQILASKILQENLLDHMENLC